MITAPRYSGNMESSVTWMPYDNVAYFNKQQEKLNRSRSHVASFTIPETKRSQVPDSKRSQAPDTKRSQAPPDTRRTDASTMSIPGMQSKTLMNRSSMKNNIITGEPNVFSGYVKPKLLDQ